MDNGARLPLYAGTRLGEGTQYTRIAWRGGYVVEVGCGRLPPWKGQFSLERKSFQMELGLAKPGSHPSPSLRIG